MGMMGYQFGGISDGKNISLEGSIWWILEKRQSEGPAIRTNVN